MFPNFKPKKGLAHQASGGWNTLVQQNFLCLVDNMIWTNSQRAKNRRVIIYNRYNSCSEL